MSLRTSGLLLTAAARRRAARPALLRLSCGLSSSTTTPAGGSSSSASDGSANSSKTIGERLNSAFSNPEARQKGSEKMIQSWSKGKGWREALDDGLYQTQIAKREDAQRERMLAQAKTEFYGMDEFADELRSGLQELEDGMTPMARARLFADKMTGGDTQKNIDAQKADIEKKLRIMGEFTPSEKKIPKLLDKKARAAIAEKLGVESKDVEEVIFQYQLQYSQWTFLRREHLRGRRLPVSSDELEWRLQKMPTKEYMHVMRMFAQRKKSMEKEQERLVYGNKKNRKTTWIERWKEKNLQ